MADGARVIPPPNLAKVRAEFRRLTELLGSPRPILDVMGKATVAHIVRTIKRGGDPPWRPLAPSTLAAKRLGRGKTQSTATPLTGFIPTWDYRLEARRVIVESSSPVATLHEKGTRGPYKIEPRPGSGAKALALPTGAFTLAGLGRSTPTGRGSFIFQGSGRTPRRFAGREGRTVVPYQSAIFRRSVMHPGVARRRMTPTDAQITPVLNDVVRAALARVVRRG